MNDPAVEFLIQLIPLFVVQVLLLFAIIPLASKSGGNARIWVVFSLIPLTGGFAFPILLGRSIAALIERVEALSSTIATKQ